MYTGPETVPPGDPRYPRSRRLWPTPLAEALVVADSAAVHGSGGTFVGARGPGHGTSGGADGRASGGVSMGGRWGDGEGATSREGYVWEATVDVTGPAEWVGGPPGTPQYNRSRRLAAHA